MNFTELLRQLKEEKKRLDRSIASLEAIWEIESQARPGAGVPIRRKGRRTMPESERLEVSRRMKQYWATWRRQRSKQRQERDKVTSANA